MPIQRIPVLYKFGIITKTHQENLKRHRYAPSNSGNSSPTKDSLEEIVLQLQNEKEDLLLFQHEEAAKNIIHKITFKLNSMDNKSRLATLALCWKDLLLLAQCGNARITADSLKLLHETLDTAPLSRRIIASFLDVSLHFLQWMVGMSDETNFMEKEYSNNELLVQTAFIVFARIYYHHKAGNITQESCIHKLEEISLLCEGLVNVMVIYQERPIIWTYISIVHSIILKVCCTVMQKTGNEMTSSSDQTPNEDQAKAKDSYQTDVCEDGKNMGSSDESEYDDKQISVFLWNALNIWKSIARKVKLKRNIIDELCDDSLKNLHPESTDWLDNIVAIHVLCECSKLKSEYLTVYLRLSPKPKKNTKGTKTTHITNWHLQLYIVYLQCLTDIAVSGLTSDIITSALFGDNIHNGLVDYLEETEDDNGWMVQQTAYQYLYVVYTHYKGDNLKENVVNMIWNVLQKFLRHQHKDVRAFNINKSDEKNNSSGSNDNNVFTKIATNFSIMFLPNDEYHPRQCDHGTKEKKTKAKTGKSPNISYDDVETRLDTHMQVQKPISGFNRTWPLMQGLVTRQFVEDLEYDEIERERITKEFQDLGLVKKPEFIRNIKY